MPRRDERIEMLELIYEAALDRRVWPRVLDRLAELTGAAAGQLGCHDEALAATLPGGGSLHAVLALYHPTRTVTFDRSRAERMSWLIPHVQRALQLNLRLAELEIARTASGEILDRLPQACLLVDAACRVLFSNRAAEEILADRCGLHRCTEGKLHADRPAETTALHKLLAGAAGPLANGVDGSGGRLRLSRDGGRAPLTTLVIPLRAEPDWLPPHRPAAILFVFDPGRTGDPTAESLRQEFGLTAAEAAVALEILNGNGLKSAARRLGISPATARTHLTAIFGKTNTGRQAELVRVLLQRGCPLPGYPAGRAAGAGWSDRWEPDFLQV